MSDYFVSSETKHMVVTAEQAFPAFVESRAKEVNRFPRASGLLLHPTSLPGPHGIGDLGQEAYRFVDFLVDSYQRLWQILPLNPPSLGESPYTCFSAFAGNPLLISLERLVGAGLLQAAELEVTMHLPTQQVDYEGVRSFKVPLIRRAYLRLEADDRAELRGEFSAFCQEQESWLEDYALFMALKSAHGGTPWTSWEKALVVREPEALEAARRELQDELRFHQFTQFIFFRQWSALKRYANERGVQIIGDIPIFVAHDSADVWAHQELFNLDERGAPTLVAGVPPDYFSASGQLWGNPLYRWERLAQTAYAWWVERFRMALRVVDIMRVDHFRGFEAYWEVPASQKTAVHGRWVKGPGEALFLAAARQLGPLPIIVEDLGLITPEVETLRDELGYPGMKVLQFAFGETADNPYLPHNYDHHCVVYTGTHDNNTTAGWFAGISPKERVKALAYLDQEGRDITRAMIRLALASVADTAIIPVQDVLGLGSEGRMNCPGQPTGNWTWRLLEGQLTAKHAEWLRELTEMYGRWTSTARKSTPQTGRQYR